MKVLVFILLACYVGLSKEDISPTFGQLPEEEKELRAGGKQTSSEERGRDMDDIDIEAWGKSEKFMEVVDAAFDAAVTKVSQGIYFDFAGS